MYDNINDREIETMIEQQIQIHHNSPCLIPSTIHMCVLLAI
jgi:hypothetical protein